VSGYHSAETVKPTSTRDSESDTSDKQQNCTSGTTKSGRFGEAWDYPTDKVNQPALTAAAVANKKSTTGKPSEATEEVKVPQSRKTVTARLNLYIYLPIIQPN